MNQTLTGRLIGTRGNKLLATRRGNVMVAVAAAVLAAILLLVYLNGYRTSLDSAAAPTPVLVAKRLIAKGTPAAVLGSQAAYELTTLAQEHTKTGAVADPDLLEGRIAVRDILPGQQLTVADFSVTTSAAVATKITGAERAISVPADPQRGLIGHVAAGDNVDVYVSMTSERGTIVSLLRANVTVLAAAGAPATSGVGGGGAVSYYVLKVPSSDAGRFAYASDEGTIWFVARPKANVVPTKKALVTIQQVLAGQKGG
jgi:Flp pilus assembly protein CpaB